MTRKQAVLLVAFVLVGLLVAVAAIVVPLWMYDDGSAEAQSMQPSEFSVTMAQLAIETKYSVASPPADHRLFLMSADEKLPAFHNTEDESWCYNPALVAATVDNVWFDQGKNSLSDRVRALDSVAGKKHRDCLDTARQELETTPQSDLTRRASLEVIIAFHENSLTALNTGMACVTKYPSVTYVSRGCNK